MKKKTNMSIMAALKLAGNVKRETERDFSLIIIGSPDVGKGALKALVSFEATAEESGRIMLLDVPDGTDASAVMTGREPDLTLIMLEAGVATPAWVKPLTKYLIKNGFGFRVAVNKADLSPEGPADLSDRTAAELELPRPDVIAISLLKSFGIREHLLPALVSGMGQNKLSFGVSFPIFRDLIADRLIQSVSIQNTAFSLAGFIPGADMPVLVMNQLRLVFQLAALYGEDVGMERALDAVATFGAGILFRAAARELLDLLPGWGWIIKGGVSYGGTLALGKAARRYYETGRTVSANELVRNAGSLVRKYRAGRAADKPVTQG